MRTNLDPLRKAAILVSCLDSADVQRILQQMSSGERRALRQAQAALGPVSSDEQQAVLEEFFRIGPVVPPEQDPGIELDSRLAERLSRSSDDDSPLQANYPPAPAKPEASQRFSFLNEADARELASAVQREHPQTIAVIVSHLRPQQAADLLAYLPAAMQSEIALRLVDLAEMDLEILAEIEHELESWLQRTGGMKRKRSAGLAALDSILSLTDAQTKQHILRDLSRHDRQLASRLKHPPASGATGTLLSNHLTFAQLDQLDDESLTQVFHAVETEVCVLALVGSSEAFVQRVLRQLPFEEARTLRYALDHLGPTRLADVDEAQRRVAQLAQEFIQQQRLTSPARRHVSIAV